MKKMITALLLCVSMALPLAACGAKESAGESGTTAAASESEVQSESEGETETETEEDPYIYAFEYDLSDYVKLCDYKGLEYTAEDTSVTEEEVQSYIDYILDAKASHEQITDRAAADGDTVNINFKGTIDGKEFSGGSAEEYELTLGSGSFIDGFETGLVGVKPGETVTLDLKFPDDYYQEDYAGKAVKFETTLNYIQGESIKPELNDDFAKELGIEGVATADELKDYLKKNIENDKKSSASYTIQSELLSAVVSKSEIKEYPADMLQVFVDSVRKSVQEEMAEKASETESAAAESGETESAKTESTETQSASETDPDAYFKDMYGQSIEDYCKESVKEMMIICAVAQKEGIEITDENFDSELEVYAQENNLGSGEVLKSQYQTNYLKLSMIYDRVLKKLQEYGKPVEAETETLETVSESE